MTKMWIPAEEGCQCEPLGVGVHMRNAFIHLYISPGNSQAIKSTITNGALSGYSDLIGEWVIPAND